MFWLMIQLAQFHNEIQWKFAECKERGQMFENSDQILCIEMGKCDLIWRDNRTCPFLFTMIEERYHLKVEDLIFIDKEEMNINSIPNAR